MPEPSRHREPLPGEKPSLAWGAAILFVLLSLVSLGFQIASGAWRSDFGGHADEGAHVVTSLMVRDFLAGGFLETPHPMRYAEAYYERFPKVALGHYPPGFYLVTGLALVLFRSDAALLAVMNLLAAAAGTLVWRFGCRVFQHRVLAAAVALLYVALPQTRTYTAIVMADLLLVLFVLMAARSFDRFLRCGGRRDSLLFGLWAAAAILTKGSGVALALLPPIALALARRWRWVFKPALWIAPIPVLVLTLPWMLLTVAITKEGMQETSVLAWTRAALPFYGAAAVREVGWTGLVLLGAAAVAAGFRGVVRKEGAGAEEAVLWAVSASGLAVVLLVPTGLDRRYLMPLVPAILLLGAASIRRIAAGRGRGWEAASILVFVLLVFAETWRPVRKLYTGAVPAIAAILKDRGEGSAESPSRVLVVSDARGEGSLIAAAALVEPRRIVVSRGTKLLSASDWVGRNYRPAFQSREEFLEILAREGVAYLVIDPPPGETASEHWKRCHGWLGDSAEAPFRRIAEVPSWRRESESHFSVFRIGESLARGGVRGSG